MPTYHDPIEGGFYVQWYQLRQSQLGYQVLSKLAPDPRNRLVRRRYSHLFADLERGVQLVDYGCGALAFPLGLAMFLAECLRRSISVKQVRVEGFDYDAMLDLGADIWHELRESISGDRTLRHLASALALIDLNLHPLQPGTVNHHRLQEKPEEARWLTAFHVVYESNLRKVRDNLAQFVTPNAPDLAIFTAPRAKVGSDGLGLVDPLRVENGPQHGFRPSSSWHENAQHITGLRRRIADTYGIPGFGLLTSWPVNWHLGGGNAQPFVVWYDRGVNGMVGHGR